MSGVLYLDTSALVKLYIAEPGSEWVQTKCERADLLIMSPLQETELKNAVLAACGRGTYDRITMRHILQHINTDLSAGTFTAQLCDWPLLWQRANQLAEAHTPRILCRTLDILHVAIAETAGTDLLITGDGRQLELCRAIGLKAQAIPT